MGLERFLLDLWLEGGPLCDMFCRIFDLIYICQTTVAEMSNLGRGVGRNA